MTLTLYVDLDAWETNVRRVAADYGEVLAVVKGNGYGFGLAHLARAAVALGLRRLAVGTVHELAALPPLADAPVVLTPLTDEQFRPEGSRTPLAVNSSAGGEVGAVLMVGSRAHVAVLADAGAAAAVIVKLGSSMRRYGVDADSLGDVLDSASAAGLDVQGFAVHLPLTGDVAEVDGWLKVLPGDLPLSVSHLLAPDVDALRQRHPQRRIVARLGSALWHGDKSFLALRAGVIDARPVKAGDRAGYRQVDVPGDGTLVMVGAGTAHGVHALPDGRSPFHFAHRRLALLEPPHMHTAMAWVPVGDPTPEVGDEVDVQQPLTFVAVDRVVER